MEWQVMLVLVLGILIILFPVAYLRYWGVGSIYAAIPKAWKRRVARDYERGKARDLAIIDRRVKSGVLSIGRSMRIVVAVVLAMGVYASLIWFCLAGFGWGAALAVGLATPAIAVLAAFVWYLNVSGLFQVIRDIRQKRARERRLARMLRQAMIQMLEETLAEERPLTIETVPRERPKV